MWICFQLLWVNTNKHDCELNAKSMFNFIRNCQNAFQSGCAIMHSAMQWHSSCSTPLSAFSIVTVPDFGYADRYAVAVPHNPAVTFLSVSCNKLVWLNCSTCRADSCIILYSWKLIYCKRLSKSTSHIHFIYYLTDIYHCMLLKITE